MKYEKILKKYNMKEEPASQYMDKKICHNKKDTEKNTELSYRTIQRYEKKFGKMTQKERNTLTAHLSINNATKEEEE